MQSMFWEPGLFWIEDKLASLSEKGDPVIRESGTRDSG